LFVVGNKCDLVDERKVETTVAEALATELDGTYCEVSAKSGIGVDELFLRVAEGALRKLQGAGGEDSGQPKVEISAPPEKKKKKGRC
jgi:GTPase SAR1 family protein